MRLVSADKLATEIGESSRLQLRTHPGHQPEVKVQVVQRDEAKTEDFLRFDQMTQVST
jgi:hypothetical protein